MITFKKMCNCICAKVKSLLHLYKSQIDSIHYSMKEKFFLLANISFKKIYIYIYL